MAGLRLDKQSVVQHPPLPLWEEAGGGVSTLPDHGRVAHPPKPFPQGEGTHSHHRCLQGNRVNTSPPSPA